MRMRLGSTRVGGISTAAFALALALPLSLAACGGSTNPSSAPTDGTEATATATATATPAVGQSPSAPAPADAGYANEPCAQVTEPEAGTVFTGGTPTPEGKSYGEGFAQCLWEKGDAVLRLSFLPPATLKEDYVDSSPAAKKLPLGDDGAWIPGVLGIGAVSSGGATVMFVAGGTGVMVGVRSGADTQQDLQRAIVIGERIAARIG